MDCTNDLSPSIINAIMDMDVNDNSAVEDVMDVIIRHPYRASFLLGSLLSTVKHRNIQLAKSIFCHHDAWSPDDFAAYIFGIEGGPHFLVNIFEPREYLRHNMPFSRYGRMINGEPFKKEDIPVPPVQCKNIEKFVRIDVFDNIFTIKNVVTSLETKACGRFYTIGNVDIDEIVMSLHRRLEGYRLVDVLTYFNNEFEEEEDENRDIVPYIDRNDTFENKILNFVYELQKNIRHLGDLSTFVKGMLPGLKVYHPYDDYNDGQHIVAVQTPADDGTLFIIAFDRKKVILPQRCDAIANMHNLLSHYIPDCISNANRRNVILLAITYNAKLNPHYEDLDSISSVMHSSESSTVKNAVEFYKNKISLLHRCRKVILKNMCLFRNQLSELPRSLQQFIESPESSNELIDYRMDV